MDDADHFKLLHTYHTPRVALGRWVRCALRGEVEVVEYTDAPIPWPVGKADAHKSIVVFKDLVKAIKRESAQAVGHWWGVKSHTVWRWRKALGVGRDAEGTHRLLSENALTPEVAAGREKAHAKSRDAEADAPRRAKIAEAKRGKARPRHVMEAMREANLGAKRSDETRAKMSESHRARGTRPPAAGPPWTPAEEELLRTLPPAEVAKRTGRTLAAVWSRRRELRRGRG